MDGFYEWLRDGTRRQPMRIHDPDERPLALAGLWTGRQDAESGEWHRTFTIVTTRPNAFMAPIHDRMPVVVPPESWAAWLDPTAREPGELRALLEPRDDVALAAYPVPPLVNNVRNNGPELIDAEPVERRQPGLTLASGAGSAAQARLERLPADVRDGRGERAAGFGPAIEAGRVGADEPRERAVVVLGRRREHRRLGRARRARSASARVSSTRWAPANAAASTATGTIADGTSSVTTRTANVVRYWRPSETSAGVERAARSAPPAPEPVGGSSSGGSVVGRGRARSITGVGATTGRAAPPRGRCRRGPGRA